MARETPHPAPEILTAFARGLLGEAELAVVSRHLRQCGDCRKVAASTPADAFVSLLRQHTTSARTPLPPPLTASRPEPPPNPTPAPVKTMDARLGGDKSLLAGYQIAETLGEGGMGIVYKAWQPSLQRWVALKMIRAEALDNPMVLARFQKEARAVARLNHANIVTVHEVGTHDGQPFLALEFVGGGTLAALWNNTPQDIHAVARTIETLARAMHHTHRNGLVHRDLKPANVLLTEDGQPKVTDFGIARRLDTGLTGDQSSASLSLSMTAQGQLLGTPSYMAPEQAWGTGDDIGPWVDTYALGVLLYEGLIGQPPFRAATPERTLVQVLHDPPRPPGQLRRTVPRDLEAICLKCLAKAPALRYASALDLAEDLARFLRDEFVEARPVGRRERLAKWCRRQPLAAVVLAVLSFAVLAGTAVALFFAFRPT